MSNPIIAKLFEENEKLKNRVRELESSAVCTYCGKVSHTKDGQAKLDMMIEHMAECEKHPVANLLVEIEALKADKRELVEAIEWAMFDKTPDDLYETLSQAVAKHKEPG
jgi:uncharacterized protein YdcH (DUF465 family)